MRVVWQLVLPYVVAQDADGDGGLRALMTLAAVSCTLRELVAADEGVWRTLCLRCAVAAGQSSCSPTATTSVVGFDRSWLRSFWSGSSHHRAGGPAAPALLLQATLAAARQDGSCT
jgi:hypothetical protein